MSKFSVHNRAIEVAAMLGDSVVAVHHVMSPRSSKARSATLALFAAGGLALLLAASLFAAAAHTSGENAARRYEWVHVLKRPAHAFREELIAPWLDWATVGGALFGLMCVATGLMRYRDEKRSPYFRVGPNPDAEFSLAHAGDAALPLVAPHGDDFVCNFTAECQGVLHQPGQEVTPLAALRDSGVARPSATVAGAWQMPIPADARIRVNLAGTSFLISAVPLPRRQAVPAWTQAHNKTLAFVAASAAVHLGVLAVSRTMIPIADAASFGLDSGEPVVTASVSGSFEQPPLPAEESGDTSASPAAVEGTAMALPSGTMGTKDAIAPSGRYRMKSSSDQEQLARQRAIDAAAESGILGAMRHSAGGAFAHALATADLSSGFDSTDIYGGLSGADYSAMAGGFGFGPSGFDAGGGGNDGFRTIGSGRYKTIGFGPGATAGYGPGGAFGRFHSRTSLGPVVRIGLAECGGGGKSSGACADGTCGMASDGCGVDKAIIRRYIRRNEQKLTYCYEKQLLTNPSLSGTVTAKFFITPAGSVVGSTASGMDADVASCVAGIVDAIVFPMPKTGGGINVTYPFHFRPTGG